MYSFSMYCLLCFRCKNSSINSCIKYKQKVTTIITQEHTNVQTICNKKKRIAAISDSASKDLGYALKWTTYNGHVQHDRSESCAAYLTKGAQEEEKKKA